MLVINYVDCYFNGKPHVSSISIFPHMADPEARSPLKWEIIWPPQQFANSPIPPDIYMSPKMIR